VLRATVAGLTEPVLGLAGRARLARSVLAIDSTDDIAGLIGLAAPMRTASLAGD
jgi:hypothetical protein